MQVLQPGWDDSVIVDQIEEEGMHTFEIPDWFDLNRNFFRMKVDVDPK